jgi:hypothetical protein
MEGKAGCHPVTLPEGSRHPIENEKQEERIGQVKEEIRKMMPPRVQPKELTVDHMGEPGQGLTFAAMVGSEGPDHPLPGFENVPHFTPSEMKGQKIRLPPLTAGVEYRNMEGILGYFERV